MTPQEAEALGKLRKRLRYIEVCKLVYEVQRKMLMFYGVNVVPWEQVDDDTLEMIKLMLITVSEEPEFDHEDVYQRMVDSYETMKPWKELANFERAGIKIAFETAKVMMNRF